MDTHLKKKKFNLYQNIYLMFYKQKPYQSKITTVNYKK